MKTPHWGRDAQVLYSCVRNMAHPGNASPLSPAHSSFQNSVFSLASPRAVLSHPSLLKLHVRSAQPALWSLCVCHPILGAHSVRLGTSVLVMLLGGSGVQKKT